MSGRLVLVPNALDLGAEAVDLRDVLPDGVIRHAASIRHWAVEDARSARAFLKRVAAVEALALPLQSIAITELPKARKGSQLGVAPEQWNLLLQPALEGHDLGLLSEAGLPAVADPGAALVQAAHAAGLEVLPLAGSSSLLLALAASGLNGQSFAFVGYLPQEAALRGARIRELESVSKRLAQTQLVIETPYRNAALFAALLQTLLAQTRLSISCGLTLAGGWSRGGTIADWRSRVTTLPERWPAVFCILAG